MPCLSTTHVLPCPVSVPHTVYCQTLPQYCTLCTAKPYLSPAHCYLSTAAIPCLSTAHCVLPYPVSVLSYPVSVPHSVYCRTPVSYTHLRAHETEADL
eukprot:3713243-Rhodomonas_salina.6